VGEKRRFRLSNTHVLIGPSISNDLDSATLDRQKCSKERETCRLKILVASSDTLVVFE
jgi:hypothetical protein